MTTVSVEEACAVLNVHANTLRRWLNDGRIKGVKVGGDTSPWRIPQSELNRILEPKAQTNNSESHPIYAFVSLKGGVGKTTGAFHFAAVIANRGFPVVLVDADPQESGIAWAKLALEGGSPLSFEVVAGERDGLAQQARLLALERVVVIDTPPNAEDLFQQAALVSDLAMLPVSPTVIDVERLGKSIKQLQNLTAIRRDLNIRILVIRHSSRELLSREAGEYLKDFPLMTQTIRDLKSYKASFGTSPAYLDEFDAVYREVTE